MTLQSIEEAIKSKASEMPEPARWKRLDILCPKCGEQTIVCCHVDVGAVDYYDNFCHVCLNPNCDYSVHREQYTGTTQQQFEDQLCPFCGRDVFGFSGPNLIAQFRQSKFQSESHAPIKRVKNFSSFLRDLFGRFTKKVNRK